MKVLALEGVASRREAWFWWLLLVGAGLLSTETVQGAFGFHGAVRALVWIVIGALAAQFVSVLVRRMHDTERSGWWVLLTLVPLIGALPFAYFMLAASHPRAGNRWPWHSAYSLGWGVLILLGLLVASLMVWAPVWINQGSMKPTLLVGDVVFALRTPSLVPVRGDIVVFRHPVTGAPVTERLIGLPGDRIEMRAGVLILNDTPVPQVPDGAFQEIYERQGPLAQFPRCENAPVGQGGTCSKSRAIETLPNGVSYAIVSIEAAGYVDTTAVFTVPEGEFFVLGDNRDNAADSRLPTTAGGVGFVPFSALVGRVDRVLASASGPSILAVWTWRFDRILQALH